MTLKVTFKSGQEITGHSYEEIVTKMEEGCHVKEKTQKKYMKSVAKRAKVFYGESITKKTAEDFILELRRISEIRLIERCE